MQKIHKVISEYNDLPSKKEKLDRFIKDNPDFYQMNLLSEQSLIMENYLGVLQLRIDNWRDV